MRVFGWVVVAFSFWIALMGSAPFTPAIFAVLGLLPAAALLVWCQRIATGLLTFFLCIAAFTISPLKIDTLLGWPPIVAWVLSCALAIGVGTVRAYQTRLKPNAA